LRYSEGTTKHTIDQTGAVSTGPHGRRVLEAGEAGARAERDPAHGLPVLVPDQPGGGSASASFASARRFFADTVPP
jgi:hypothetical protein